MSCLPTIFEFEDRTVRSVLLRDAPWFVANDVCQVLGISDARQALDKLDDDERGGCSIPTPYGQQDMRTVSESGLYTLILRCRGATTPGTLPHRFRKWVTSEVLPAIRRTGAYAPQADRYAASLQLVAECRRTFGAAAAQKLWRDLGLPAVQCQVAAKAPRPAYDLAARVERLLRSADDAGVTRTVLYRHLDAVCRAAQLDAVMDALAREGRVVITKRSERASGRPVVTYRWRQLPTAH